MTLGRMHLVLIDEADGMTNPAQLALLSKLDATAFPPNTIFVFTCNGTDGLEPRFISRCRTVEFSSYGMAAEITAFLEYVWHSEGGKKTRGYQSQPLRPKWTRYTPGSAQSITARTWVCRAGTYASSRKHADGKHKRVSHY
jgi:hypothetical protein